MKICYNIFVRGISSAGSVSNSLTHPAKAKNPNNPIRGISSAGRALHWQCRGQRFDPAMLHQCDVGSNSFWVRRCFFRLFIAFKDYIKQ